MSDTITLCRPDDWHLHLRDAAAMADVVGHTAARFGRAMVMPNLQPPITDTVAAERYRQRILAALPTGNRFQPLMTLYLTDNTTPEQIAEAAASGIIYGVKLYPAGATTHSAAGVTDLHRLDPVMSALSELQLPLLVHGEVTDPAVDIFDREGRFIEQQLRPLLTRHPDLRLVVEHATTADAVAFVQQAGDQVAATITPQHLLLNRNALFQGGLQPHHYCLPVLKRERHREALLAAASGGDRCFFLGTDSAPHPRHAKESGCGCAGIYSAHAAIELYAEAFDTIGAIDRLEAFAAHHGADFYRLPRNSDTITLRRQPWQVPDHYRFGEQQVVPLRAGATVAWTLQQ